MTVVDCVAPDFLPYHLPSRIRTANTNSTNFSKSKTKQESQDEDKGDLNFGGNRMTNEVEFLLTEIFI